MPAGQRRHFCQIQQPTAYSENASGDPSPADFVVLAIRWLMIKTDSDPKSPMELAHDVECPNDSKTRQIDKSMRIVWPKEYNGGDVDRILNVVSVTDPKNRRREIWLTCLENTEAETAVGGRLIRRVQRV
jgi:hypothetical protein